MSKEVASESFLHTHPARFESEIVGEGFSSAARREREQNSGPAIKLALRELGDPGDETPRTWTGGFGARSPSQSPDCPAEDFSSTSSQCCFIYLRLETVVLNIAGPSLLTQLPEPKLIKYYFQKVQ